MSDTATNPAEPTTPPADAPPAEPGQTPPSEPNQTPPQNPPTGEDGKTLIGAAGEGEAEQPSGFTFDNLDAESIRGLAPEGFEISEEQAGQLQSLLGEAKTSEDLVKGLLTHHAELLSNFGEELAQEFNTRMDEWATEVENAPEFQGGKLAPALAQANELADRFGGREFMELLSATGAGNSIHTLRFFQNLGKALPQEGTPASPGAPSVQPKSLAERMFGDTGASK